MASIKIDRRFFANVRKDYSNFALAFAREALQNCVDYGRRTIRVQISLVDGNTLCVFENDGPVMTADEAENKLLSLGATGKDFAGTIGGFGRAKEVLYFTNLQYQITSGSLVITGSGGDYSLTQADNYLAGTRSEVLLEGDLVSSLERQFQFIAGFSNFRQTLELSVNGQPSQPIPSVRRGLLKCDFDWASVYVNKSLPVGTLFVRIGGLVMFAEYLVNFSGAVFVELQGSSGDLLTSNRDGLQYQYRRELTDFISLISVDRRRAFRQRRPRFERYEGRKLAVSVRHEILSQETLPPGEEGVVQQTEKAAIFSLVSPAAKKPSPRAEAVEVSPVETGPLSQVSAADTTPYVGGALVSEPAPVKVEIGHDFILENDMDHRIPSKFRPESFSASSKKLLKSWVRVLLEVHRILERSAAFSVGFSFCRMEEEGYTRAQYVNSSDFGSVYFLTPAVYDESCPTKQKVRPVLNLGNKADRMQIIALAAHEVVHGMGFDSHDEAYASQLTEVMGRLLPHYGTLKACFRG